MNSNTSYRQPGAPTPSTPIKCMICFTSIQGLHFPWCQPAMRADLDARLWAQARKDVAEELRRRRELDAHRAASWLFPTSGPRDVAAENASMASLFDFNAAAGNRNVVLARPTVLSNAQLQANLMFEQVAVRDFARVVATVPRSSNSEARQVPQRLPISQHDANAASNPAVGRPKTEGEARETAPLSLSGLTDSHSQTNNSGKRRRLTDEGGGEGETASKSKKKLAGHTSASTIANGHQAESAEEEGAEPEEEDSEDEEERLERLQRDAMARKVAWKGCAVGKLNYNVSETYEETFSKSLAVFKDVKLGGGRRMTRKAVKDTQALE